MAPGDRPSCLGQRGSEPPVPGVVPRQGGGTNSTMISIAICDYQRGPVVALKSATQ